MRTYLQSIIAACADTLFPPDGDITVSGTQAGLVDYTERYMAAMSWKLRWLIWLMFLFIQLSPWLVGPREAPFVRLSPEKRHITLDRLYSSRIYFCWQAFISMRAILTMGYLSSPAVMRQITGKPRPQPPQIEVS